MCAVYVGAVIRLHLGKKKIESLANSVVMVLISPIAEIVANLFHVLVIHDANWFTFGAATRWDKSQLIRSVYTVLEDGLGSQTSSTSV